MTYTYRLLRSVWPFATLAVGFALANGCGRTGLDGIASISSAADANSTVSTGGAGGAISGPCPEAPCLASLFQACVPEGSCSLQGAGGPSASALSACYANGVTVHSSGAYNGSGVTWTITVMRNGSRCYTIAGLESGSAISHVFSDSNGQQVATGITDHDTGSFTVTCNGGKPISVNSACMNPTGDGRTCPSGTCP